MTESLAVSPRTIIVTAGGMKQPIDDVRALVNSSRGTLGIHCVEAILRQTETPVERVFYIHGPDALIPPVDERVTLVPVRGVYELLEQVTGLLQSHTVHYVIHSMAVADYVPAGVYTPEQLSSASLTHEGALVPDGGLTGSKISSDHGELYIKLERAPKVIDAIKAISPHTFLVGFKLLSDATDEQLHDAAFGMLRRTRAGLVLANDLSQIRSGQPHRGLLVYPEKHTDIIEGGKEAIADRLIEVMFRRGETRYGQSISVDETVSPMSRAALGVLSDCGHQLDNGALPVVDGGTYGNMSVRINSLATLSKDHAIRNPQAIVEGFSQSHPQPELDGDSVSEPLVHDEHDNEFVITGRGVDKRHLTENDILHIVDSTEQPDDGAVYRTLMYRGPVKPSIDSAIHATLYEQTVVDAMVHIHDPAIYEGIPLTENNYACGTEAERNSIAVLADGDVDNFLIGFHKHGLLAGGKSLDACLQSLASVKERLHLTPLLHSGEPIDGVQPLLDEWQQHVRDTDDDTIGGPTGELLADDRLCYVAVTADGPVGLVGYTPLLVNGVWSGYFWMYLSEQLSRERGLGERIVGLVAELARRDRCQSVTVMTRPGCKVARYYEERLGFTPRDGIDGCLVLSQDLG